MKRWVAMLLASILFLAGCAAPGGPDAPSAPQQPDSLPVQETETDGLLPELTVTVFDLGKADSILIEMQGYALLIDTGETQDGSKILDVLADRDIQRLDLLILTHLDKDHIGGAAEIIRSVAVARVIQSRNSETSESYAAYQAACAEKGILPERLMQPQSVSIAGASFDLTPGTADSYADDNDYSIMTRLTYGTKKFLFAGDAQSQRLREFLSGNSTGPFDFLKVPHHGRASDLSAAFVQAVRPQYAVITCSKKNPPDDEVIDLLRQTGAQVFLTQQGYVTAICNGQSLTVRQRAG